MEKSFASESDISKLKGAPCINKNGLWTYNSGSKVISDSNYYSKRNGFLKENSSKIQYSCSIDNMHKNEHFNIKTKILPKNNILYEHLFSHLDPSSLQNGTKLNSNAFDPFNSQLNSFKGSFVRNINSFTNDPIYNTNLESQHSFTEMKPKYFSTPVNFSRTFVKSNLHFDSNKTQIRSNESGHYDAFKSREDNSTQHVPNYEPNLTKPILENQHSFLKMKPKYYSTPINFNRSYVIPDIRLDTMHMKEKLQIEETVNLNHYKSQHKKQEVVCSNSQKGQIKQTATKNVNFSLNKIPSLNVNTVYNTKAQNQNLNNKDGLVKTPFNATPAINYNHFGKNQMNQNFNSQKKYHIFQQYQQRQQPQILNYQIVQNHQFQHFIPNNDLFSKNLNTNLIQPTYQKFSNNFAQVSEVAFPYWMYPQANLIQAPLRQQNFFNFQAPYNNFNGLIFNNLSPFPYILK